MVSSAAALASAKARGTILGKNGAKLANENRAKAIETAMTFRNTVKRLRLDGVSSVRGIAEALNSRQILTAQGHHWHPTSVHRLLKRLEAV